MAEQPMSARSYVHLLYEVYEQQGFKAARAAGEAPYEGME